ncbi:MAG: BlaI/MecI/CopY family transcriptional regulator [Candidatus Omnitrophica bacterium]|nr:BlaI/MecI/CopY family transcriptional regulator [Candidatus Omnitrophota bacterium]MCA9418947.1 BlaI/MecI/CopY family transcriptional regulator [Candidatus Omnitrophota bacterium]MCB9770827.1 BlaI/MecI/CopY family transcriptional regulator [Candidatus Omnitrophota bacterium]MCB9781803.1 BlaI/MecI/CopY family transcriptional regulator [Candidatus Omnitrophota bacterium]
MSFKYRHLQPCGNFFLPSWLTCVILLLNLAYACKRTTAGGKTLKPDPPKISEAEWQVMSALWRKSPLSFSEINDALEGSDWSPKTVGTLIRRLVEKGAIRSESQGKTNLYHPTVTEDQMLTAESESFLSRFFGGQLNPMVAHFFEKEKLSKKEIEEIKKLIERMEEK